MKIDVLYFEGCPHATDALKLVKDVLKRLNIEAEVEFVKVNNPEEAEKLRFYGSPSIHINGIDLEEGEENRKPLFGCRVYQSENGFSGLPPEELFIKKILEAKGD